MKNQLFGNPEQLNNKKGRSHDGGGLSFYEEKLMSKNYYHMSGAK